MQKDKWYWEKIVKKFWAKVEVGGEDECWIWKGRIGKWNGYGQAYDGYRTISAHIMSWKVTNGNVPKIIEGRKVLIRHTCSNKLCVNPRHIGIGTYSDNANDVHREGKKVALDIEKVREVIRLRSLGMTHRKIGRQLKVSETTISRVDRCKGIYREIRNMIDFQDRL